MTSSNDRDRRDAASVQPTVESLDTEELLIDVHDNAAVARYRLIARVSDATVQRFRVTDVLRQDQAGWAIVHHHSERNDKTQGG